MAARELFAKMAGALDSNRKIRRGGRNAREVYLWVLRQVALRDSAGGIPIADVTDFGYLAGQLMCSEDEAREGFERAVTVALLSVTESECLIVGWDDEWGRRAMSNAERQARFRGKGKGDNDLHESDAEKVTETPLLVTDAVTRNAGEERRGEERESRVTASRAVEPFRLDTDPQRAAKPARARQVKHALPTDWQPTIDLIAEAHALGIDPADQANRMRDWAAAEGAKKQDWNAAFRNWIRRKADERPRSANGAGWRLPEV